MRLLHTESSVSSILTITTNADLAHLVEQLICNHQVVGSNPTIGTKVLSECIVSLVDDPPWKWEAVGSNPTTQTNCGLGKWSSCQVHILKIVGSNPASATIKGRLCIKLLTLMK